MITLLLLCSGRAQEESSLMTRLLHTEELVAGERRLAAVPLVNKGGSGCSAANPCGMCEGDCDWDADCAGDLKCFRRTHTAESVPGCISGGAGDTPYTDYCWSPISPAPLQDNGGSGCSPAVPCGECQGDCDSDDDCAGLLKCFQRSSSDEVVPGCTKGGAGDVRTHDYCYNPEPVADPVCTADAPCRDMVVHLSGAVGDEHVILRGDTFEDFHVYLTPNVEKSFRLRRGSTFEVLFNNFNNHIGRKVSLRMDEDFNIQLPYGGNYDTLVERQCHLFTYPDEPANPNRIGRRGTEVNYENSGNWQTWGGEERLCKALAWTTTRSMVPLKYRKRYCGKLWPSEDMCLQDDAWKDCFTWAQIFCGDVVHYWNVVKMPCTPERPCEDQRRNAFDYDPRG